MVLMADALDRMVDHAMHQAQLDPESYEAVAGALETLLKIAIEGGLPSDAAGVVEDFITNHLGED